MRSLKRLKTGPSRRGNNGRGVFPGPATFAGPPPLKITDKGVSDDFFPISNIHEIHFPVGLRPDPVGKLTTRPRQTHSPMVRGHSSHVSFGVSISAPTELGPARWFPGPRCGCRRAWLKIERTLLLTAYIVIDEVSNSSKVYDFE